jgi:hypothetical protein
VDPVLNPLLLLARRNNGGWIELQNEELYNLHVQFLPEIITMVMQYVVQLIGG